LLMPLKNKRKPMKLNRLRKTRNVPSKRKQLTNKQLRHSPNNKRNKMKQRPIVKKLKKLRNRQP